MRGFISDPPGLLDNKSIALFIVDSASISALA
jgi:hypothetical protein